VIPSSYPQLPTAGSYADAINLVNTQFPLVFTTNSKFASMHMAVTQKFPFSISVSIA
jgi:hypothetical protein